MENSDTNYYDDDKNYLFVKKGNDGKLLDHIFIHMGNSDNDSFLAYFDSYDSDAPLKLYKFQKIVLPEGIIEGHKSFQFVESKEEQTWRRMRVRGSLPSNWEILFKLIEGKE